MRKGGSTGNIRGSQLLSPPPQPTISLRFSGDPETRTEGDRNCSGLKELAQHWISGPLYHHLSTVISVLCPNLKGNSMWPSCKSSQCACWWSKHNVAFKEKLYQHYFKILYYQPVFGARWRHTDSSKIDAKFESFWSSTSVLTGGLSEHLYDLEKIKLTHHLLFICALQLKYYTWEKWLAKHWLGKCLCPKSIMLILFGDLTCQTQHQDVFLRVSQIVQELRSCLTSM